MNISAGDLSGLLEILREHGEAETADEAEQLAANGDTKGALQMVLQAIPEKGKNATARTGVICVRKNYASLVPG